MRWSQYNAQNNDTQISLASFALCMHAAAIFQAQSTVFFTWKTCSWTVQNNAQNALKVAILRYKIKNFSEEGHLIASIFFRYFRPFKNSIKFTLDYILKQFIIYNGKYNIETANYN